MFVGHYAPALAAATLPRAPRLWVLFVGAQAADIVFFLLTLNGVERYAITPGYTAVSPFEPFNVVWSHSLLGSLAVAAAVALVVRLATRSRRAAWIAGAVAACHWPLDWLVHVPDLSIAGGAMRHGLGLFNRPFVALPLELALLAAGLVAYDKRTLAPGWRGRAALALLAGALVAMQMALWLRPPALPAEPAPANIAWSALALYTLAAVFAWWTDLTRVRR